MKDLDEKLKKAVRSFWRIRTKQAQKQGAAGGGKDRGARGAVTGGAQLDGFIEIVRDALVASGLPDASVYRKKAVTLPGYFRPHKAWDLIVVIDKILLASVEFKSQVGSFGNNFNNRTEEAIGNATDLWTAYREGAFADSPKPWLGYLFLLEESPGSTEPVKLSEPHFSVLPEFVGSSYAKRYEIFCKKLVRERLYDAACLLLTSKTKGKRGEYREPASDLSFRAFLASLMGRAIAYATLRKKSHD